jgi:hypothetical protein
MPAVDQLSQTIRSDPTYIKSIGQSKHEVLQTMRAWQRKLTNADVDDILISIHWLFRDNRLLRQSPDMFVLVWTWHVTTALEYKKKLLFGNIECKIFGACEIASHEFLNDWRKRSFIWFISDYLYSMYSNESSLQNGLQYWELVDDQDSPKL